MCINTCAIACVCTLTSNSLTYKALFGLAIIVVAAVFGHFPTIGILHAAGQKANERNGRWIGFLERALVSAFVLLGLAAQTTIIFATKAAVIGLRVPAGDDHAKKKYVEYMLVGTMASFLVALLVGFLGKEIWGMLK